MNSYVEHNMSAKSHTTVKYGMKEYSNNQQMVVQALNEAFNAFFTSDKNHEADILEFLAYIVKENLVVVGVGSGSKFF